MVVSETFKNAAMDAFVYSTVRNAATFGFLYNWLPFNLWGKASA